MNNCRFLLYHLRCERYSRIITTYVVLTALGTVSTQPTARPELAGLSCAIGYHSVPSSSKHHQPWTDAATCVSQ